MLLQSASAQSSMLPLAALTQLTSLAVHGFICRQLRGAPPLPHLHELQVRGGSASASSVRLLAPTLAQQQGQLQLRAVWVEALDTLRTRRARPGPGQVLPGLSGPPTRPAPHDAGLVLWENGDIPWPQLRQAVQPL